MAIIHANGEDRDPRRRGKPRPSRTRLHRRTARLLLLDDHELSLAALQCFFSARTQFQVVTQCLEQIESLHERKAPRPDLVLINLRMPRFDGANLTRLLLETAPAAKVIGFNGPEDRTALFAMLRAGARGYLTCHCSPDELFRALETVHRGELAFSPSILRMIADDYAQHPSGPGDAAAEKLSERDRKILASIADGFCNKEIASALGMSVRTIEKYRELLMAKLRIRSVSGLTKFAIRNGMTKLN